jgi:flagellar biosynthesis protein FlhF
MNLKTYRADTMAKALAEVKKDLGSEAVILHTRSFKVGGVMGVGAKAMVEITAADTPPAGATRGRRPGPLAAAGPRAGTQIIDPHTTRDSETLHQGDAARQDDAGSFQHASFGTVVTERPKPAASATSPVASSPAEPALIQTRPDAPLPASRAKPPAPTARASLPTTRVALSPESTQGVETLKGELAAIKSLVGQVLRCTRAVSLTTGHPGSFAAGPVLSMGSLPEALLAQYLALQTAGVAVDLCESILGSVRDELDPSELSDDGIVEHAVTRHLAKLLPVVGGWSGAPTGANRPRVIALVGPTGVGKTTTVAKLAATFKLRQNRSVGLITTDTYRIAAVDQLRTYANIIGLPVKVAMTADEVADAVASLAHMDVVILDTAGRSQLDRTRLDETRALVDAARPDETHLVLSSSCAEPVLLKTLDRFSIMAPDRVIYTKLDEAVTCGVIPNVVRSSTMPISYITMGQEVPDHIEPADANRLARMVLSGTLVDSDSSPRTATR